jgi:hypothetical protein
MAGILPGLLTGRLLARSYYNKSQSKLGCLITGLILLASFGGCYLIFRHQGEERTPDKKPVIVKRKNHPSEVLEYMDLNGNGKYDLQRNVREYSDGRREVWNMDLLSGDYTEEEVRRKLVPQANEIRFLSNKD